MAILILKHQDVLVTIFLQIIMEFFPDHLEHYYMYFDKDGIIYKVDTGC